MVITGLAQFIEDAAAIVGDQRVGLIANPTAVDHNLVHVVDLAQRAGVNVTALFGPEHGLRGDAQDMIAVDELAQPAPGHIPEFSLYGHTFASLTPTPAMLAHVDTLVFDIQDVGSRYYTFVWTMVLAMRAAAQAGKRFVVLDRPNPIGGALVEGGAISAGYESFVGLESCPNRHGLTAGEIARWRADVEHLDLDLVVVPLHGWRRDMFYEDTGLPWVMPSPNMPTVDTAMVYPGMCLLEGTELSEGRGTTRPFELVGAAGVDGQALADWLNACGLPGVRFRPVTITPTFHKHAGVGAGGVQLHVTDRRAFRPYLTGVAVLRGFAEVAPQALTWRAKAYEFVDTIPAIDLLCGSPAIRLGIERGDNLEALAATWREAEAAWREARAPWLLYR